MYKRKRFAKKKKDSSEEVKKMGKIKHKITEVDGIKFHSKMESEFYEYLKNEKAIGNVKSFTLQPTFILQDKFIIVDGKTIPGTDPDFEKIKRKTKSKTISAIKYISDFDIIYKDGRREIIDVKGQETADFKIKKKMFHFRYPDLTLNLVSKVKGEWVDYSEAKKKK